MLFSCALKLKGQTTASGIYTSGSSLNAISTAVPFLNIAPDARSSALGDAGVALEQDANATYWNPAKMAFIKPSTQFSLSYSPWLRRVTPNANLAYLSFSQQLDERNTLGLSLRYFNLGTADLFDNEQNSTGIFRPYELSLDAALARKFGDNFSIALSLRYVYSSLTSGLLVQGQQNKPGTGIATDVSLFYKKPTQQFGKDAIFALGLNISNIGTKISYSDAGQKYFLPTNLRFGATNTWYLDQYSLLRLSLDLNKLLVPTAPVRDSEGNILKGKDDNRSVVAGIFGSFNDAPNGFKEEMQEISFATGIEYWYNNQFALRTGYFYENPNKGNRKYITLGGGFKYNKMMIDFSYLLANQQQSPLANTLRFSLGYAFGESKN
ncbi:hypothetical protein GCM10008119_16480 [Pedobacter mendelii]|uniref:Type IX secretion system protein PorV domain-containing protein n=1 Tax=Pedobacter mendelii TaxID=1908240 RepID=A0ABQ2BGN3_9SPHI|nr:hypothetical protein GCM10008119_16480 [Pedobacter mendelii]